MWKGESKVYTFFKKKKMFSEKEKLKLIITLMKVRNLNKIYKFIHLDVNRIFESYLMQSKLNLEIIKFEQWYGVVCTSS